jgi:hypothetical protein
LGVRVYINATSTPHQKNRIRPQRRALVCIGPHSRAFNRAKIAVGALRGAYLIRQSLPSGLSRSGNLAVENRFKLAAQI